MDSRSVAHMSNGKSGLLDKPIELAVTHISTHLDLRRYLECIVLYFIRIGQSYDI